MWLKQRERRKEMRREPQRQDLQSFVDWVEYLGPSKGKLKVFMEEL